MGESRLIVESALRTLARVHRVSMVGGVLRVQQLTKLLRSTVHPSSEKHGLPNR